MDKKIYWIWLQLNFGPANDKVFDFLDCFGDAKGCYENIDAIRHSLKTIDSLHFKINNVSLDCAKEYLERTLDLGYDIICYDDVDYPVKLKNIYNPPIVLYVTKNFRKIFRDFNFHVAVVGSRKPSIYGVEVTNYLTNELINNNAIIISGLAYGIDKIAHEVSVKRDKPTIAVLGNGLDITYPSIHKNLRDALEIYGACVTEFVLGTAPNGYNFPIRNRIMAGLSDGVLITEASKKSGTLITAKYAFEEGREIFAVPANIFSSQLQGTNFLIKNYAKLVVDVKDIMDEFKHIIKTEDDVNYESINTRSSLDIESLDKDYRSVISALDFEPKNIESILNLVKLDIKKLNEILLYLELNNIVESLPGKLYTIKF